MSAWRCLGAFQATLAPDKLSELECHINHPGAWMCASARLLFFGSRCGGGTPLWLTHHNSRSCYAGATRRVGRQLAGRKPILPVLGVGDVAWRKSAGCGCQALSPQCPGAHKQDCCERRVVIFSVTHIARSSLCINIS